VKLKILLFVFILLSTSIPVVLADSELPAPLADDPPTPQVFSQLPSAKDTVASDTTTSATFEDVDGLTVTHVTSDTSDILLFASVQATGSASGKGGWRLVYDGVNYLELERQIETEPGNLMLVDLITSKASGSYTFKLQHRTDTGTLTTANSIIVAVSLHDGTGSVPVVSDYVASDTVGSAWEDIPGLTQDITLSATSHIWAVLVFNGYIDAANKPGFMAINIDGTRQEEHERDFPGANLYGCMSVVARTATEKTSGTYTVKGEWKGGAGSTLTGEDFKLVAIAAESQSGSGTIDIQKAVQATEATTATSLEDILALSVTASLDGTSHILSVMTLDTDTSKDAKSAYTTISIDGTDQDVMERGHASKNVHGSVGQVVRTASTLSSGSKTVKGRWYTDATNTLSGANIVLTTIVLGTNVVVGNTAPTIDDKITGENWEEDSLTSHQWNATDPDADTWTWTVESDPSAAFLGIEYDDKTAWVNGSCRPEGSYEVWTNISDGTDSDSDLWTLTCNNQAVAIADKIVQENWDEDANIVHQWNST
jgi:hypothetical protein